MRGRQATNFAQLEAFCEVVEAGSFTAAAERMHVTQPAVSMHVRALEKQYGLELLERRGDGVVPTAAGQALYRRARVILRQRLEAVRELGALRLDGPPPLVVGASSTGVAYYLPPLLRRFREDEPTVRVLLRVDITDRIVEAVVAGEAAIGAVWGPTRRAELRVTVLGEDRFAVVAPADHPLVRAHGGRRSKSEDVALESAAELGSYAFVLGMPGSATRLFIEAGLRSVGLDPPVAAEVVSSADMKRAVEDGVGLAVVSRKAVEGELASGRLRALAVPGLDLWREVDVILPRRRSPRGTAERLAAALAAGMRLPRQGGAGS
jgi:DNA-binding transcriptional LysR family regulator